MKRLMFVLLFAAATLVLNGSQTHAEYRCPACGKIHSSGPSQRPSQPRVVPGNPQRPYDPSWFRPELYPKYYGGFHYRALEYYGYPAGDIGVRGFAW